MLLPPSPELSPPPPNPPAPPIPVTSKRGSSLLRELVSGTSTFGTSTLWAASTTGTDGGVLSTGSIAMSCSFWLRSLFCASRLFLRSSASFLAATARPLSRVLICVTPSATVLILPSERASAASSCVWVTYRGAPGAGRGLNEGWVDGFLTGPRPRASAASDSDSYSPTPSRNSL